MSAFGGLRSVDFYRRIPVDLTEPTAPGAIISMAAIIIMFLLFVGEVRSFITPPPRSDFYIASDTAHAHRLKVNFDMTFHKLPCFIASIDILDVLGNHEVNIHDNTQETRISRTGVPLSIYEESSSHREEDFKVMADEGCNIKGFILVQKVPGNFHVSAHGARQRARDYLPDGVVNVEHTIHHLQFGEYVDWDKYNLRKLNEDHFQPTLHPLDGTAHRDSDVMYYEYFLDIVPTTYGKDEDRGYQFTSTAHKLKNPFGNMAGAVFQYNISPLTVSYGHEKRSVSHFLTYLCAIIGGVFTVAGLLSRLLAESISQFQKRMKGKDN